MQVCFYPRKHRRFCIFARNLKPAAHVPLCGASPVAGVPAGRSLRKRVLQRSLNYVIDM